jgi:hypothetical protein
MNKGYICGWPNEYDKENVSVVSLANTRMTKKGKSIVGPTNTTDIYLEFAQ